MEVEHNQLSMVIKQCYKSREPLFIHGTIGIGKSDTIRRVAKTIAKDLKREFTEDDIENGKFGFVDIRISQLDSSDLRGLPRLDGDTTRWLPPSWLPKNQGGVGILFFDEMNLAPPSIQASAYQLILDRRLGDYKLPPGWVIIAAGNRVEDRANVFEMSAPLKNRFAHTTLKIPSIESWKEWALDNAVDNRVVAFLCFKPTYLFKFDEDSTEHAFPTPRSWNKASNLVNGITNEEMLSVLISAQVGEAASIEFVAFDKLSKKINLDNILKNPEQAKNVTDIGLKYSLVSGIAEKYRQNEKVLGNAVSVCKFIEPEFAVFLLRMLKSSNRGHFKNNVTKAVDWKLLVKQYSKYLH